MLEVVAEGFFYAVGEILAYTLWPILYYTGWLFLKTVTFGHYPPKHNPMAFTQKPHSKVFVRTIGFIIWGAVGVWIYQNFGA